MVNKLSVLHLILLSFIIISNSSAATYPSLRFERLKTGGDTFNEQVRSALVDSLGFLWLCTENGLVQYNGYTAKYYRHDVDNQQSISENITRGILEDRNGYLWVGTKNKGLNRFDPRTEKFTRYWPNELKPSPINHIFEDSLGIIWLSTWKNGLLKLDPKTGRFTQYTHNKDDPSSIAFPYIWKVIEDPVVKGNLWIATSNGLDYFDRNKQDFTHYKHEKNNPMSLSNRFVRDIYFDSNGVFWIGTHNGLNQFLPDTNNFVRHYPDVENQHQTDEDNLVFAIHEDKSGGFWIGTYGGGLKEFDRQQGTFISHLHHPYNLNSLRNNLINPQGIVQGQSDLLWVLTGNGVNKLNLMAKRVKNYLPEKNNSDSLSGSIIWDIYESPKKQLWIGTHENGLNRYDEEYQRFIRFRHDPQNLNSLSNDRVNSILVDRDETLWVGTANKLNRRDKGEVNFRRYEFDTKKLLGLRSDYISSLLEDHLGRIWIGTQNGLRRYNKETDSFTLYFKDENVLGSLSNNNIRTIYEDPLNRLWIGTRGGLNLYDPVTDTFSHFLHDPQLKTSLSNNLIDSIYLSTSGHLWVGTEGGGIDRLDLESQKVTNYNQNDGLINNMVRAIFEDEFESLWIVTSTGLSRFDFKNKLFRNFSPGDGFQKEGYNTYAAVQRVSGEIVLGGVNGIDRFFPKDFPKAIVPKPLPIVLTDFLVFNRSVPIIPNLNEADRSKSSKITNFYLKQSINHSKEIELSYKESIFSFEFSALNFLAPSKIKYSYQLEGVDKSWVMTPASKRFATYMNVPAGEYLFKVKAANKDGIWSEEARTLKLRVLPPFWLTWWAKIIYVLISIVVFVSFYHVRTASLRRRARLLEKEVSERTETIEGLLEQKNQLFANISHEFRTPLTLVLGPLTTLRKRITKNENQRQLDLIERNSRRLSTMVNQILDLTELTGDKITPKRLQNANKITHFICESFQSLLEEKNLNLTLSIKSENDLFVLMIPDALQKVLLNLISNAFKYTLYSGTIDIKIESLSEMLLIKINDTGLGMSQHDLTLIFDRFTRLERSSHLAEGTGIGLALVKEIVEHHGGSISVESELGVGSCFKVSLPLAPKKEIEAYNFAQLQHEINSEELDHTLNLLNHTKQNENYKLSTYAETHEPSSNRPSILIIEDNPEMQNYIADTLRDRYAVDIASNGNTGIEIATKFVPDLIISDIMMPEMDGYQVAKRLKSTQSTSHIPLILLTAKGDKQSRIRGWQENVDEYLIKPFDAEELLLRIANLLAIRELLRQRFKQQLLSNEGIRSQKIDVIGNDWISAEEQFVERFNQLLNENISNSSLKVATIAQALYMTERQLFRKLKALLNATPGDYLRNLRLEKASHLLKQGRAVGEVAFSVGFSSHSNFNRCFKARFGVSPKKYTTMNIPMQAEVIV